MNVTCANSAPCDVKKKIFTLKPVQKNGLILQIHHTIAQYSVSLKKKIPQRIRFIFTSFDKTGKIIANADIQGNVFIIDFMHKKFWSLPKFDSCSVLKFSSLKESELVIGANDGKLFVLNIHTGCVVAIWEDHKHPVKDISFAEELCLTASAKEAIIYDIKTYKKLHALSLNTNASLRYVVFTPVSHYILACFNDYFINVWEKTKFESVKQILPTTWNKRIIKCIAFTRNEQLMVLAGNSTTLIVFSLDTWTISKTVTVPIDANTIRLIDFIPQDNDAGSNKILAILSGDGILYIYNMESALIIKQIQHDTETMSFECSKNGHILACVLHSGEINIYRTSILLTPKDKEEEKEVKVQQKLKLYLPPQKPTPEVFDVEKLRTILQEYGEYPNIYRGLIWSKILNLPGNKQCYSAFINTTGKDFFPHIEKKYPLINKSALRNLKKLLNNLATWCPFFQEVKFLPLFVFPFLKIFENDPIACFEAVCTVIINWSQHWFEYSPYPPVNVLAIIENVLHEHDKELLTHFTKYGVTSCIYGWSLLEVAFSEVLTTNEWCILWDHIISNEPSFILLAVVAYNIVKRGMLLSYKHVEDFEGFFHSQNSLNFKRFISKVYLLNKTTSEDVHPRQYLNFFVPLSKGEYPVFLEFPQVRPKAITAIEGSIGQESGDGPNIAELEGSSDKSDGFHSIEEERRRIKRLEELYREKILLETEKLQLRRQTAGGYPKNEKDMNTFLLFNEQALQKRQAELNNLLAQMEGPHSIREEDLKYIDEKINENVCQLLEQKMKLQEIMMKEEDPKTRPAKTLSSLDKEQKKLKEEHMELQRDIKKILKQIKIINEKRKAKKNSTKITALEETTRDIEKQVNSLLTKLAKTKFKNDDNPEIIDNPDCGNSVKTKTPGPKRIKKRVKPSKQ